VTSPVLNDSADAALYTVTPAAAPESEATEDLVAALRTEIFPAGVEALGASAHVAGTTANFIDLADRISSRLPWFIGAVVAASFILLVVVFRSVLVPLKAAVLNLLSIGAAYGVLVAIFQWGWMKGLVGLEDTVPITSVIPMFMFAVLFGLSMDYEVFLLSRVREEYELTGDNTESVVRGLAATGRTITSAAAIMVAVFFGFVLSDDPLVKMAGVGLGTAILVDATIVRAILVPSTMSLLGDLNWWIPRWLEHLLPVVDDD
jgi:RND superfamily putative drug exporter